MNLLKDKNFQTRAGTAGLFVAVIIAGIFIHEYTFYGLVVLINFLCLNEFYKHTIEKEQSFFIWYCLLIGVLILVCNISYRLAYGNLLSMIQYVLVHLLPLLLFLMLFIQLFYKSEKPFTNSAFGFFGLIYITLPLSTLFYIKQDFNPWFILLLFGLVWLNDTGAYIGGSLFGKTKLLERVSPKKTWEGTIGGILLCMLVAAPYGKFVLHENPIIFAGLGFVIGVFSTLGDLIESQLKRSMNIKDSGTFLPGHGGFLDRFDGFLMAMPAAFFYLLFCR